MGVPQVDDGLDGLVELVTALKRKGSSVNRLAAEHAERPEPCWRLATRAKALQPTELIRRRALKSSLCGTVNTGASHQGVLRAWLTNAAAAKSERQQAAQAAADGVAAGVEGAAAAAAGKEHACKGGGGAWGGARTSLHAAAAAAAARAGGPPPPPPPQQHDGGLAFGRPLVQQAPRPERAVLVPAGNELVLRQQGPTPPLGLANGRVAPMRGAWGRGPPPR